jgi:urease accessory protein
MEATITTPINTESGLPLVRLMHLVSPSLPVGGFTYSQGIERAVEDGWISEAVDLERWLRHQLHHALTTFDLPLLARMHSAVGDARVDALETWTDELLAGRESAELRLEEQNRGRALADLLAGLKVEDADRWKPMLARCQAAGFAFAAVRWNIAPREMALGYAWSWLENLVLAAVKIIPLGQTEGQRVLQQLSPELPVAVDAGLARIDEEIGASCPALAIASSRHETQYTRLFRS